MQIGNNQEDQSRPRARFLQPINLRADVDDTADGLSQAIDHGGCINIALQRVAGDSKLIALYGERPGPLLPVLRLALFVVRLGSHVLGIGFCLIGIAQRLISPRTVQYRLQ